MDKGKNNFGKLLINLCKVQNLFIMNGREGSDSNIGKLTCRNASAVDYFICSPNIIKCIDDLTVLDFSNCFSDVHTPLSITFESNVFEDSDSDINALDNTEHIVKIKKWENEKLREFRGNFNRQASSDLRNKLRDLGASRVTQEQMNTAVNEFGKIYIDSAKETFGTITKFNNRKKKRNTKIQKPWFDLDYKFERQYYRKTKPKNKFRNSDNSRKELKEAEKKYKKQEDASIDLFILKNMGAAIIDFRVCPPLVKCQNIMFSGFIDTLMYGFSSTRVTIYCYFGLKFNDNTCCEVICKRRYNDNDIMTTNKLPGMYFFLITDIFPIQNLYKSYLIKNCMHFFSFFVFLLLFKHKKKGVIK
jgi:hypothetical protein